MQAGRARHLGKALHGAFNVFARNHHEIRHLVHDDHDERQRLEVELLVLVNRLASFLVVAGVDGAGQLVALCLRLSFDIFL